MNYKKLLTTAATVTFATVSASQAAVIYNLGSGKITTGGTFNDAHTDATGSFTTTAGSGSAGISFNLAITSFSGSPSSQTAGLGVDGGRYAAAIDNNYDTDNHPGGNTTYELESMTITISGVSGLGAGESLVISQVSLVGAADMYYTVNGGADMQLQAGTTTYDTPDGTTLTLGAAQSSDRTDGSSYFVWDSVTIAVVPEPSSTALLGLGGLALILRRRK